MTSQLPIVLSALSIALLCTECFAQDNSTAAPSWMEPQPGTVVPFGTAQDGLRGPLDAQTALPAPSGLRGPLGEDLAPTIAPPAYINGPPARIKKGSQNKHKGHSVVGSTAGLPDRTAKTGIGMTDRTAKTGVGMTDRTAKTGVGLTDRAAKTTVGLPIKAAKEVLKALF